jgi:hypothetical protein
MSMDACGTRKQIDEHFAGVINAVDERAMRAHVATCDGCRAYYRRRVLLAKLDPSSPAAEVRIVRGLRLDLPMQTSIRSIGPPTACILLMAAALFLFLRPRSNTDGFTARGSAASSESTFGVAAGERGSSIQVYRVSTDGDARLAVDVLGQSDELAFSYVNLQNKKRLMIFGVDDHQRVYWFFPAWTTEAEDPVAIPIESGSEPRELREAIGHHFEGSRLDVHAVFLDEPLTVRQMESMIGSGTMSVPRSQHLVQSFAFVP